MEQCYANIETLRVKIKTGSDKRLHGNSWKSNCLSLFNSLEGQLKIY